MIALIPYIIGLFLNMGYIVEPNTRFLVPKNYRGNANNYYDSIVSTYHAFNVVKYSSLFLLYDSDMMIQLALYHSLTYFILDTYVLLLEIMFIKMKKLNLIFIVHHIVAIYFAILVNMDMVFPGKSFYFGSITFFTELPVIFLNLSKYLHKSNKKDTLLYSVNNNLCKISYFIFRIINLPYIAWITLPYSGFTDRLFLGILTLMNYIWFYIIVQK
jgi:hypothetical protein